MPAPRPLQHLADERAALHESLHGPITLQDRLEGGDEPSYLRSGLARSVLRDLRRGRKLGLELRYCRFDHSDDRCGL
mgnify:CR=1 FL=1